MHKKTESSKKYLAVFLIAVLVAGLLFYLIFFKRHNRVQNFFRQERVISCLFVGTDESRHKGRTDTIMVGLYNTRTRKMGLIVVPRDVRVRIKDLYYEKINSIYSISGVGGLKKYLEGLLGIPIDFYAILDIESFVRMIDIVGGIEVFNEDDMNYIDHAGNLFIDLPAGELNLDGEKIMEYVRFRADERGDAGRLERQLEIIQLLLHKLRDEGDLMKNLRVVKMLLRYLKTNLSVNDIIGLLRNAGEIEFDNLYTMRVPGVFERLKDVDYIVVDDTVVRNRTTAFLHRLNAISPEFDPSLITVQVLNGTEKSGMAAYVRNRLLYFGYNVVEFGNAPRSDYKQTFILDRSGNLEAARKVAEILKCEKVYPKIDRLILIDVTVILGEDMIGRRP